MWEWFFFRNGFVNTKSAKFVTWKTYFLIFSRVCVRVSSPIYECDIKTKVLVLKRCITTTWTSKILFSFFFFSNLLSHRTTKSSSVFFWKATFPSFRLFGILFRQDVGNVVPRMAVESLLQSLLIQIVACCCSKERRIKTYIWWMRTTDEKAELKPDAHVPIKPVQRPKTKRPLIVPISIYSCASSLRRNGRQTNNPSAKRP